MEVFLDESRFRVLNAGRRWGKSRLSINELFRAACNKPGSLCWYIAPTFKQAKQIAWELCKKLIPKEAVKSMNEVELSIRLINGSKIELKGAENEDGLTGVGLEFVVLDEAAMLKRNVWPQIVRPMLTDTKGRALFISTPRGKDYFWELWVKGEKKENGFKSWTFKTEDNPFIDTEEVEAAKKELSDSYYRQEYEASFEDYAGLIWPEFSEDRHVIDPMHLPEDWDRRGVIDTAISGITCVLKYAVDYEGTVIFYDEYYEANKRVSEVCQAVKDNRSTWIIDPASKGQYSQREGQLYSLFNEYNDYGIMCIAGENDVDYGINRVAEYFKQGRIRITSNCKHLIWELQRYHWAEARMGVAGAFDPKPYKEHDHACDCLRMAIASRPSDSDRVNKIQGAPDSAWELRLKKNPNNLKRVYA